MAVLAACTMGFPAPAGAGTAPARDLAAICARTACRTVVDEFRLRDAEGGTFILNTGLLPYVDDGRVTLFAGETLAVGFDGTAPRYVSAGGRFQRGAPGSVALRLEQQSGRPDMVLSVESARDTGLAFDATLFIPTPNGMASRRVSDCVAAPNSLTRASWRYPVAMVVLSNFRSGGGATSDCR
jgi:hypothetical protein